MSNGAEPIQIGQACLCGGSGNIYRIFDGKRHIGWMAACDVCGAATIIHQLVDEALQDWFARLCPYTFFSE